MNIKNWKVNKRFVALVLAGTISFSLVGCGNSKEKKLESEIVSLQSEVASLKDDVNSLKSQLPDSSTISSENQAVTTSPEESIEKEPVTTSPEESIETEPVTTSLEESNEMEPVQEIAEQNDKTAEAYKGIYIEVGEPYYCSDYRRMTNHESDGYLRNVSLDGNIGVIDVSSRENVISPSYKSVELDNFCFIVTQNDDKKRLVFFEEKNGQLDVEENMSDAYDEIGEAYFSEKYFSSETKWNGFLRNVTLDGKVGVIDAHSGEVVISLNYKAVELKDDHFVVTQNDDKKRLVFFEGKNGQLDVDGNMTDAYDTIGEAYCNQRYKRNSDSDGYVRDVTNGDKKGLIAAADGKVLIPTIYTNIGEEYYDTYYKYYTDDDMDGYLRNVSIGKKNGIIDASDFSVVIPAEYSDIQFDTKDIVVTDTEGLKKTLTYGSLKK